MSGSDSDSDMEGGCASYLTSNMDISIGAVNHNFIFKSIRYIRILPNTKTRQYLAISQATIFNR